MRVKVVSAFRAGGKVYSVGDVVDLADPFGAEMVFNRKVVATLDKPAEPAPAKRKRGRPRKTEE